MTFGVSFAPTVPDAAGQMQGPGGAAVPPAIQRAIRLLSLRLPRIGGPGLFPGAIAPGALLHAPGWPFPPTGPDGTPGLPPTSAAPIGGVPPSGAAQPVPRIGPGRNPYDTDEVDLTRPAPSVPPVVNPNRPSMPTFQPGGDGRRPGYPAGPRWR